MGEGERGRVGEGESGGGGEGEWGRVDCELSTLNSQLPKDKSQKSSYVKLFKHQIESTKCIEGLQHLK